MHRNPLENIEVRRTFIPVPCDEFPDQGFYVRGLTIVDAFAILQTHGKSLLPAVVLRLDPSNVHKPLLPGAEREILDVFLEAAPGLLNAIVARGADESNEAAAERLPFGVHLLALVEIFELSKRSLDMTELMRVVQTLGAQLAQTGGRA